jgi:hypothetical protein
LPFSASTLTTAPALQPVPAAASGRSGNQALPFKSSLRSRGGES